MLKKWILLLISMMFALSACNSPVYNQTEANVADVTLKAAKARRAFLHQAHGSASLDVRNGPYVDMTPISLSRSPSWLHNQIIIRGDQLPFSYYSRIIAKGAGTKILTKYQQGLDQSVRVTMNYSGTVQGALDTLATKAGFVYSVLNGTITWNAFVTRTFDIAFMPGGTDYLMGKASSGSGSASVAGGGTGGGAVVNYVSSDYSDSEFSNLKGTLSIWKDLGTTIKELLSPDGKVIVSESTTSVTVRDKSSNVNLVSQYIANLNKTLARQVLVKVQVLEVTLENDFNYGINWSIIANSFNKTRFLLNGNYGTPISITALTAQPNNPVTGGAQATPVIGTQSVQTNADGTLAVPSYTVLVNALNQQGKTSIVSEPRVVCLNNQVGVVRIVQSEGYVASIENTSLSGGSGSISQNTVTSQITPGTLITGLTLYILPKIMKDKVFLQVNADLSTKDSLITFGAAGAQVQLPTITVKHFNQRSMIKSGDTLILSGFRQLVNKANANQMFTMQALGGKGSQEINRETIVLITPIVMGGA